jgi:hypothetical protein
MVEMGGFYSQFVMMQNIHFQNSRILSAKISDRALFNHQPRVLVFSIGASDHGNSNIDIHEPFVRLTLTQLPFPVFSYCNFPINHLQIQ